MIEIDIENCTINILVPDEELEERRSKWKPREQKLQGYLKRYARNVTSGSQGAILE